jgi:[acyl-carrier-protein] S-malonyltransferase
MKNEIASLLTVFASMVQLDEHPEEWEEAQAFAGYSVGQFTALYAAGRLSDLDAIKLVHQRALAMNQCLENSEPSGMIACIGIMETELTKILLDSQLPSLNISNYNSPGQYTISGKKNELEQLLPMLSKARKVLTIPTDGAWHSTYMNGAKESISEFTAQILKFNISHPLPVICNVTGDYLPFDSPENCIDRIGKQVSEPVQWEKGIRHLIKEGFTDFLEMGHGNSLTKFGFFIDRSLSHRVIHSR